MVQDFGVQDGPDIIKKEVFFVNIFGLGPFNPISFPEFEGEY